MNVLHSRDVRVHVKSDDVVVCQNCTDGECYSVFAMRGGICLYDVVTPLLNGSVLHAIDRHVVFTDAATPYLVFDPPHHYPVGRRQPAATTTAHASVADATIPAWVHYCDLLICYCVVATLASCWRRATQHARVQQTTARAWRRRWFYATQQRDRVPAGARLKQRDQQHHRGCERTMRASAPMHERQSSGAPHRHNHLVPSSSGSSAPWTRVSYRRTSSWC